MPVGDVLVGNAGGDVKHDDTALAVDVVSIAEAAEFFLSSSVPDIKLDLTKVLRHVRLQLDFTRWQEVVDVRW